MTLRSWARTLLSFVPGFERWWSNRSGGGDTASARYCYSVWLRHLVRSRANGVSTTPSVVAELGPGASIGVGLAALLCGAERYYALDVIRYAALARNLAAFDGILALLQDRAAIPDDAEFPELQPSIDSYAFPGAVIGADRLRLALAPQRAMMLRQALESVPLGDDSCAPVSYITSWKDSHRIRGESVDLIISQAVLEHVDDVAGTYAALYGWLKPGGVMSHQIDFRCHRTAREWNGHWGISDRAWRLMRGRRAYFLNRAPYAEHAACIRQTGFEIVSEHRVHDASGIGRARLTERFKNVSDEDLSTSGVFVQARKPLVPSSR